MKQRTGAKPGSQTHEEERFKWLTIVARKNAHVKNTRIKKTKINLFGRRKYISLNKKEAAY